MDILTTMQSTYPNMTKAEKKAADFILNEVDGHYFIHTTLSQISADAGVGQASVMRMINSCGYSSYRTFMAELSHARYQASADRSNARGEGSTLADDWNGILQLCQSSLDRTDLLLAAQTICRADFVICMGYGNSSHVASLAASHLRRAGLVAVHNIPGEISYTADSFSSGLRAVVLSFSITGETREVVRISKEYEENGVCVIALTGRTSSSLAKLANFTFFTPSQVANRKYGRWLDGIVSQLFVVESLVEEIEKIKYPKKEMEV